MDKTAVPPRVLDPMRLTNIKRGGSHSASADSGRDSFDLVFTEHWPSIYRHLVRLVGDPAEAEDLALEAFFRLYQRYPNPSAEFNIGGWLYRVAINLGLQSIRGFRRREHYEFSAGKEALDSAPESRPAMIQAREEEHQLARAVLSQMDHRQSQLLILRHSGCSYAEIAHSLDLSPASIGPLLYRAERDFEKRYRALTQEES